MEKRAIRSVRGIRRRHSVILAKGCHSDGQMKVDMAMHAEMDMQDTTNLKYLAQVASSIWTGQLFTGFIRTATIT